MSESLVLPGHDSETTKLGASAAGGEEAWGQQQRQLGKKKHRRRPSKKKRHWKPYYKLTWEEKKKFDEKQSLRASRVRAEMFAKGQPVAPYNTTQFLMDDHDQEEPDLKTGLYPKRAAAKSDDTSDEDFVEEVGSSSGENEAGDSDGQGRAHGEFQQRDFSEAYERYHTESLQRLSKQELVRDYLDLERRLSQAEQETRRLQQLQGHPSRQPCQLVEELAAEVERLRTENQRLRQENEMWNRDGSCCDQAKPATEGTPGPQDEALFHTHVGQLGHKEAGDR
ncbi:Protein HEXIM2 [Lemmus lemmus]